MWTVCAVENTSHKGRPSSQAHTLLCSHAIQTSRCPGWGSLNRAHTKYEYTYICIYMYIHIYIYIHKYTLIHIYIDIYVYIDLNQYVCTLTYIYIYIYMSVVDH